MFLTEESFVPGKVKDTPMKASQALRIGTMLRPPVQNRGYYFKPNGSCALAAIYEGATGQALVSLKQSQQLKIIRNFLKNTFPNLPFLRILWRFCARDHSREQIANWLESRGM